MTCSRVHSICPWPEGFDPLKDFITASPDVAVLDSRAARTALKQQGLVTAPTQFNRKLHALLLPKKEVWSCEVTL